MARRTGFVWHEIYGWHDLGNAAGMVPADSSAAQPDRHAYEPELVRRIRNLVDISGLLEQLVSIKPRAATESELGRVHSKEHIAQIKELSSRVTGGDAGILSPIPAHAYDICLMAAGGAIAAAEAVVTGKVDNAYALLRPAGHHAKPTHSMGFCIFSNAAIAGRHLLEAHGVKRIAYVDWDVHHGNGTQAAFYDEPRVLTISIHQDRLFPVDDGFREQTGEGKAAGTNLNVPLPAGCGADTYCEVYDRIVIPALRAFQPEVIIVPCGFDAGMLDPLGRMMLHSEGYRRLTRKIMKIADELCGGRLVFTHEGGYNRTNLPFYGLAVMEELSGIKTDVVDPYLEWHLAIGGQEMAPHHEAAIQAAEKNVAKVPKPL